MFIGKIILNNFRIFRGIHEFDFSNKKVIVVEGPNGHGKSTIFDAINWVISGRISRYVGSSEHQQFNYIINNDAYISSVTEASVEIYFNSEKELTIKRIVKRNGSTKLFINGQQLGLREGQKKIVQLLVNEKIVNDHNLLDSIDLLSFIESTLILSQENLEEFVRGNKPTERYSKLEQILGLSRYGQDFKDYLQELKKEYLTECNQIISKQEDLKRKRELLNAEYQPKLQQSERNGIKPKAKILNELNSFWGNFQNYSLKSFNRPKNFYDITINEYEILKKYIESIEDELKRFDFLKFEIEQKEIYVDSIEYNEKIMNYKNNIYAIKMKKLKREKGIEKADLIREKLKSISLTNNYLINIKIEKENIEVDTSNIIRKLEIVSNNVGVDYVSLSYEKVTDFIEEFRLNNNVLQKLLEKNSVLEHENQLALLTSKAEMLVTACTHKNKLVKDLQNRIKKIDKQILDLDNQKKSNLESQINTIIHEVQTHLINSNKQKCLVCGSTFSSNEELKNTISMQLESSKRLVNGIEIALNEYKVQKNKLNVEQNLAEQELKVSQQELEKLKEEIIELKNKIVVMRLNNTINIEDIGEIQKEIKKGQNYKQNNENKYKGFIEIKKGLDLRNDLKLKIEKISEEEKESLTKHTSRRYLIGDQRKLQLKLNNIERYINIARVKIQEYDKQMLELNQIIQGLKRKLEQLVQIKSELKKMISCELILNSSEILDFILKNISLLENERLKSRNLIVTIEKYMDDINLRDMELKIKDYDQDNLVLLKQIDQYGKIDEKLKSLFTFHTQVQSSLVNEYLNGLSLAINNYFRQISPHSYFNYIDLITKKNELFILLKDNQNGSIDIESDMGYSVNASLTLSAAQSTILAMSIFLALNKSQNWSELNVIGIDDPFQNLDDINAYSFIDVLSNLVSVEDRQILISTHDSDFAKLTVKKMNLNSEDYAYIKIQSYTRDAIEIQSEHYRSLGE
ncbi:SMC family ATPase [Priestia sp. GS2]|uniref:SMC family ATPase n=1 Tax=Priestia sp. GS2 TaxID=3117403 RepID=UPI002EDB961A